MLIHLGFVSIDIAVFMQKGFPYILSFISVYQSVLAGNLKQNAWKVGMFNQVLWTFWIITTQSYGFLPLNLMLWYVYTKNHFKWQRIAKLQESKKHVEDVFSKLN
jgi:hypothetical protein